MQVSQKENLITIIRDKIVINVWNKGIVCSKNILRLVSCYKKLLLKHNQTFLHWRFGLYQRPSSEEACSVLIPVVATIEMQHGKKSVVRVA